MGTRKGLQTLQFMSLQTRIFPAKFSGSLTVVAGVSSCSLTGASAGCLATTSLHTGVGRGSGKLKERWDLHFLKPGLWSLDQEHQSRWVPGKTQIPRQIPHLLKRKSRSGAYSCFKNHIPPTPTSSDAQLSLGTPGEGFLSDLGVGEKAGCADSTPAHPCLSGCHFFGSAGVLSLQLLLSHISATLPATVE